MKLNSTHTVLVTGASRGIGREIALQLAAQGVGVLAWARDGAALTSLAQENPLIATEIVDLSQTASLSAAWAAALVAHPKLCGVIHNAAVQDETVFLDPSYNAERINLELAINVVAPAELSRAALPHLSAQPQAFIAFIGSALALAPKRNSAIYSASKAAVSHLSASLRAQLAQSPTHAHIQITHILPPTVDTAMTAHRSVPKMSPADVARATLSAIESGKQDAYLGKAKLLRVLMRLAPSVAKKIMLKF